MSAGQWLTLVLALGPLALVGGWFLIYVRHQHLIASLRAQNAALSAKLDVERRISRERLDDIDLVFGALSNEALKSNNRIFLDLAEATLKRFHVQAQGELAQREQSIAGMVQPIRAALDRTEQQIRDIEQERREAYGALTRHLQGLAEAHAALHGETRNLVQALRRPEVRGQWGELTLRRLVELAGMVDQCDFYEQETVHGANGALRPDMVVRMPERREIVVDVKTPLDAYLSAVEAPDDASREQHLKRHARVLRERVKELAAKAYWAQFRHSPDFVVLFIPGDQFLGAALEMDREIIEFALGHKVILATPTSLVALLRTIAYGWRQIALAENAERIRDVGEALYQRLGEFGDHLARLGKALGSGLDHYNRAVGAFEREVLPGARRFTEMGVAPTRPLDAPEPLDRGVREVAPSNVPD